MENKSLDSDVKEEMEKNKYVQKRKIDYFFIIRNYGKCTQFLNEILQTEGIVPEEHEVLKSVNARKIKYENRGGHWLGAIYFIIHAKFCLKAKNAFTGLLLIATYPLFLFDISYNTGRHLGNFLILPSNLNELLKLRQGNSIQSIQTHLLVKRCVYDELMIKNKKQNKPEWRNSYLLHQVFGRSVKRVIDLRDSFLKGINVGGFKKKKEE
jgi:hypothetical protein